MPYNRVPPDLLSAAEEALRNPDDETAHQAVEDRWRDVRVTNIEAYIRRVVDAAPPLTQSQRDSLALLFRPGGDGHDDTAA